MRSVSGQETATLGFGRRNGFTMVELAIVAAIFIMVLAILTPFINLVKDWADVVNCGHNLRQISLGLHSYAADHHGAFPAGLRELYPDYVKSEKFFYCPAAQHGKGSGEVSYVYTSGLKESSPAKTIIVSDNDENHSGIGRNTVRVDGSVQWERFKKDTQR